MKKHKFPTRNFEISYWKLSDQNKFKTAVANFKYFF